MSKEEIEKLINDIVEKRIKEEKKKLSNKIRYQLEYTGEFAKSHLIMTAIDDWARS